MRYGHASVAIGEKAYLFGGRNDYLGACKILFYYDTEKFTWFTPKVSGHLPGARDGHAMCVARGDIYMYGGYEAEIDQYSEDTFKLDMKTMQWSLLITMGNHGTGMWRDFHTFTAHNNKIYLFGGRGDLFGPHLSNREFYDNKIKTLDLDTLTWSTPTQPNQEVPIGRRSHTAFFHQGCLYVFGGYNSEVDKHFNDLWRFNPETGIWSKISSSGKKPCPRRRHCCCYCDNRVYIFGGTSPYETDTNSNAVDSTKLQTEPMLYDHSDTYMLDLEPSLKTLCILTVKKYKLDVSSLPHDILQLHHLMSNNNAFKSWPSSQG